MPKIKIKDWQGLFTDVDENDTRLELVRTSTNWKHEPGYIEFEPRNLSSLAGLPDVATLFSGFTWETGLYCTLTSDGLNNAASPTSTSYNCLVLVAKKLVAGTYSRLVYLYDLTNSLGWYELSKNGDIANIKIENHDGAGNFTNSYFNTTIDNKTFFRVQDGILKIFMPHDTFWVGRLERTVGISGLTHNDWYIDRLVEHFNFDNQGIEYNGTLTTVLPATLTPATDTMLADSYNKRRTGVLYNKTLIEDPTTFIDTIDQVTLTYVDTVNLGYGNTTLKFYRYIATDEDGNEIERFTFPGVDKWLHFYVGGVAPYLNDVLFKASYENDLLPIGTTWAAIGTKRTNPQMATVTGTYTANGDFWSIPKATFDNAAQKYSFQSTITVGGTDSGGFPSDSSLTYQIVTTMVLDERDEIIIKAEEDKITFTGAAVPWALKIKNIRIPTNINKRITRLRFYWKFIGETDFELIEDINLLKDTYALNDFYFAEFKRTGTFLAGNIGFLYDIDEASDYNIITGFQSFASESDIGIGLKSEDAVGIYHSTVGGGNLMTDLLYTQNRLPVTGITSVRAVANINDKLGVFSDNTLYIIQPSETAGQLTFTVNDTIEYGVKDINDIAETQGGILVHTRNGIFFTNGYDTELISKAINNTVRDRFDTGTITYNKYKRELYYRPYSTDDELYRYRFERKVWEFINNLTGLGDTNQLMIDLNGHRAYLADSLLMVYDATDTSSFTASLMLNNSDLGEPSVDKLINYIDIDYVGALTLTIFADSFSYTFTLPSSGTRTTAWLDLPLSSRKAFQKMKIYIASNTLSPLTKVYGIEVDFNVIKRGRYA